MLKVFTIACAVSVAITAPANEGTSFSGINEFALKLLDNTFAFEENFGGNNIAVSPLSVWTIFSLIAEGSAGDTFQELLEGLRLPSDLKATQALHSAVNKILERNEKDVTLKSQKAIFSNCSLDIHPEFCQSARAYKTDIYNVDASNTTKLANDINYFICVATEGRIVNAVEPSLLEDLKMIIVDALYFKASWTKPFDPTQTKEDTFYNSQGKSIGTINMMYHKARHNFVESPQLGAQILELTYGKKEEYSMIILLPFDGMPLKRLVGNLASQSQDWMRDLRSEANNIQIDVYIPRFKMSSRTDLIPPMQYSGIYSIFDSKKAQLPGISDTPLFVSKAIQNVEIEVNEEGTVAAAVTVIGFEDRILGQRFEANKEFVFLITERRSNVILFSGVHTKPTLV